jgi:hypothetical protein
MMMMITLTKRRSIWMMTTMIERRRMLRKVLDQR